MTATYDVAVVGLGALGSAVAWALASRGLSVVGFEQFELGHARGASHDHGRILRRSYHTPSYVRLAAEAYADWAALESAAGEQLVFPTGGLDLWPPCAAIPMTPYVESLAECGVACSLLAAAEIRARWPVLSVPDDVVGLFQADGAVVAAARTVAALHRLARAAGAELRERAPVSCLLQAGEAVEVEVAGSRVSVGTVVLAADAWSGGLLAGLGHRLPLTVTQEQVSYFPPPPGAHGYGVGELPVWIWMDDPSYYGLPVFGEPGVKVGQDVGGAVTDPDARDFSPCPAYAERVAEFTTTLFPGVSAVPTVTRTCLYTMPPDRDFVIDRVPDAPHVLVLLGAAHGFKFTPAFGRIAADLVCDGRTTSDIAAYSLDRPALTDLDAPAHFLV